RPRHPPRRQAHAGRGHPRRAAKDNPRRPAHDADRTGRRVRRPRRHFPRGSPLMPRGLLLVLADPPPDFEEELNAWYDTEHLPERRVLPGFDTALRFTSLGDGPRYAALYDLTSPEALQTPEYNACSGANFSPWTRRTMARAHPMRLSGELVSGE